MKTLLTILISALLFNESVSQDVDPNTKPDPNKELGLIAHLAHIKIHSEQKMISVTKDQTYKDQDEALQRAAGKYNNVRIAVDQLILQLMADSKSKNRLKRYKQINKFIKGDDELENRVAYKNILNQIEGDFKILMLEDNTPGTSVGEIIVAAVGAVTTIITSARDFREKKVGAICEILNSLRLRDAAELTKKPEKDEDEKPDKKKP